jgi:hypothetical protein
MDVHWCKFSCRQYLPSTPPRQAALSAKHSGGNPDRAAKKWGAGSIDPTDAGCSFIN